MSINKGMVNALIAYITWGLFPIYLKKLQHISTLQIFAHRIVWTCFTLGIFIVFSNRSRLLIDAIRRPGGVGIYLIAALLMGINWLVFLIAVDANRVTETGLGYFISPLVNVMLGVLILRERLRPLQWFSVTLAAAGVIYLILKLDTLPWMGIVLALAFGSYGLIKKIAPLDAANGLMLESMLMLPLAVGYLIFSWVVGNESFLQLPPSDQLLIVGSGAVSMLPLLMFSSAAQHLNLSSLGFLQYITPSIQLPLGVFIYHESFGVHAQFGYGMILASVAIFLIDDVSASRPVS